jgi:hypothetical protein
VFTHRVKLVVAGVGIVTACVLRVGRIDTRATERAGVASVAGSVVTDEPAPQPVPRALVALAGPSLARNQQVVADDRGFFRFESIPPGRVTITATKHGFVSSAFGATRPGQPVRTRAAFD